MKQMPKPLKLIFLVFALIVIALIISLWWLGVQYRWIGFWALASFGSFLHAIPGWAYGLFVFSGAVKNHKDRTEWFSTVFADGKTSPFWTKVYALPQALTYFVSSLAGFASLFIILKILRNDLSRDGRHHFQQSSALDRTILFLHRGSLRSIRPNSH
jgi:4-amino-4-deoxy-L-arabinose transferase-like glycosyltransferase